MSNSLVNTSTFDPSVNVIEATEMAHPVFRPIPVECFQPTARPVSIQHENGHLVQGRFENLDITSMFAQLNFQLQEQGERLQEQIQLLHFRDQNKEETIQGQEERIQDLVVQNSGQQEQIQDLVVQNSGQQEQIQDLVVQNSGQQEQIQDLVVQNSENRHQIARLKAADDHKQRQLDLIRRDLRLRFCPICQDTPRELFVSFCGHVLCRPCIDSTQNNICPLGPWAP